jgi:molybdenum cofactor biosynthesis enzyme MoaA
LFTQAGVSKVRLTGGEPTVRKDLIEIIQGIKAFPEIRTIAMTTNGLVLKNKLKLMKESGLNSLNISLDTFVEAKFTFLTRRLGYKNVLEVSILEI